MGEKREQQRESEKHRLTGDNEFQVSGSRGEASFFSARQARENPISRKPWPRRRLTRPSSPSPAATLSRNGWESRRNWSSSYSRWPVRTSRPSSSSTKWTRCAPRDRTPSKRHCDVLVSVHINPRIRFKVRVCSAHQDRVPSTNAGSGQRHGRHLSTGGKQHPLGVGRCDSPALRGQQYLALCRPHLTTSNLTLQKRIYIPLPDLHARKEMFKLHIGKETPMELADEDFRMLVSLNYT